MPHMVPQYVQGIFVYVDMLYGDFQWFPKGEEPKDDHYRIVEESKKDSWFARLSASGYLDCTDWSGPFKSLKAAKDHIRNTWEVDPVTGEDLEK